MKPFASGLFRRFLLAMLILALAPTMFMGFQLLRISKSGIQASVLELHTHLADSTAQEVAVYLDNINDKIGFTVAALRRKGLDWQIRQEFLRSFIESDPDIQEVAILRSGTEVLKVYNPNLTTEGGDADHSGDPGFVEFVRSGRRPTLWVSGEDGGVPRLQIFYPLSPVTDIYSSVVLKTLHDSIREKRVGGTGFAMMVGTGGIPLIYPEGRLSESERQSLLGWPIVVSALGAQSVGSSEYEDSGGRLQVGAYAPIRQISAAIVIQQPKDEAYIAADRMKKTATWIILLICVAAVSIALWLARDLTRPLLELTRGAETVSQGTFPEPLRIKTGDELQAFAETFNRMTGRLKKYAEMQVDRLVLEQQKTEAILFSIGDGMLMTDNEGVVQLVNRKTKEFLSVDGKAVLGMPLREILPEGTDLTRAILDAVANPKESQLREVDLSNDNRRLFLQVSSQQLISPVKKSVLGVVTALHDVTYAKELDKMKEEFLHSITHDLRNPLGSISGFLEFLKKGTVGPLNDQQKIMVESMYKSANRLMTMVSNILDVAKMQTHELEMNLSETSIRELASRSVEVLLSLAQRRGISMRVEAPDGDCLINCAGDQVERTITNLLGNAIKFAPDDGHIVVHVEDQGAEIRVCVEDDGPGIPPTHLDKIFGKFEQVPGQKRGGTGLGLTICKKFVESHHGRIWVESVLGEGARFYFTIPKGLVLNAANQAELGINA